MCEQVLEEEYYYYYEKLFSIQDSGALTDMVTSTFKDAFNIVFSAKFSGYSLNEQVKACAMVALFIQYVWGEDPVRNNHLVFDRFFSVKLYSMFTGVSNFLKSNTGQIDFGDGLCMCVDVLTMHPNFDKVKYWFKMYCIKDYVVDTVEKGYPPKSEDIDYILEYLSNC